MKPFLHTFADWIKQEGPALKVRPIIVESNSTYIIFVFHNITKYIIGCAKNHGSKYNEIEVHVQAYGRHWDIILPWLDCMPVQHPDGWECSMCEKGHQQSFPTCEAIWQDHIFNPLKQWINETLATSQALVLGSTGNNGATWARLLPKDGRLGKGEHAIPLRLTG